MSHATEELWLCELDQRVDDPDGHRYVVEDLDHVEVEWIVLMRVGHVVAQDVEHGVGKLKDKEGDRVDDLASEDDSFDVLAHHDLLALLQVLGILDSTKHGGQVSSLRFAAGGSGKIMDYTDVESADAGQTVEE